MEGLRLLDSKVNSSEDIARVACKLLPFNVRRANRA
jgi:hypothetical protein